MEDHGEFKALCHRRVQLQPPRKVTTDKRSKESEEKFWGFGDIFPDVLTGGLGFSFFFPKPAFSNGEGAAPPCRL